MPSKIQYKKKKLFVTPEMKAWFDEKKVDKSPKTLKELKELRRELREESGNSDRDHSLFRGKMRRDCSVKQKEYVIIAKRVDKEKPRADGRPHAAGFGKQTNLLDDL